MRMTTAEMAEAVGQVRYKPGWAISLVGPDDVEDVADWAGTRIHMLHIRLGTVDPLTGERMVVTHQRLLVRPPTLDALLEAVFKALCAVEEHEAGEFFAYQGRRPFDPHAPGAPAHAEARR